MNNKPLISIIIPFYNTNEKYISELLDLLKGKNSNIECVLVNDGSDEKLSSMVSNHCIENNFKYIAYSPNKGVSHARNVGLNNSSGKYILFVDSDDLIDIKLLNKISKNTLNKDIYLFRDCLILDKNPILVEKELSVLKIEYNLSELFMLDNLKLSMRSACNKLLKKDILVKHKLYFNEDLKFYEDSLFMSAFYQNCNFYEAYDNVLYLYRIHKGSSSRRFNKDYMEFYERYFYKFKEVNPNPNMLLGLYRDTVNKVFVDKTVMFFKKMKFRLMFKVAKYNCVHDSSKHLLDDENKFLRKLSISLSRNHNFIATIRVIIRQFKMYFLFLLNKAFKKSKI